jgi:hypothetical protein
VQAAIGVGLEDCDNRAHALKFTSLPRGGKAKPGVRVIRDLV